MSVGDGGKEGKKKEDKGAGGRGSSATCLAERRRRVKLPPGEIRELPLTLADPLVVARHLTVPWKIGSA